MGAALSVAPSSLLFSSHPRTLFLFIPRAPRRSAHERVGPTQDMKSRTSNVEQVGW